MITDSFDGVSPAKINPPKNKNAPRADALILTFSNVIEELAVKNYDCEKIGELWTASGAVPVYLIKGTSKNLV